MSIYTEKKYGDSEYLDDDEYSINLSHVPIVESKKADKIRRDSSKHYPNKDEAQELRKIMSSTGLSEKEVREDKKYRKQLSDARKAGQTAKRTEIERFYQNLIKLACKQTGLTPQHPETLKVLDDIIKERQGCSWGSRFFLEQNLKSAKAVVKLYARK
jgi:hypothetical protein